PAQQHDKQSSIESIMEPKPKYLRSNYNGSHKLQNKIAVITGGDSGIGRAISLHFAKEGADIAVVYLNEHDDAMDTKRLIEQEGQECILIDGDIGNSQFCEAAVTEILDKFKRIDILVNNAAEQHPQDNFMDMSNEQFEKTFKTNIFGTFYMTKAVLPN